MEKFDIKRLGNILGFQFGTGYAGNVWDKNYISPTLMTMTGGYRQPMIITEKKDAEYISDNENR